jgi:Tol biopolymer transport system component
MGRFTLVLALVLLAATGCGAAKSLPSAVPLTNVLVYAKPNPSPRIAMSNAAETIWRARIDGTHAKRLGSGNNPAVSPDGRWIAFGRGTDLLVMPAAGGAAENVYTFTGRIAELLEAPTWAPNSRLLVFQGAYGPPVVLNPFSLQTHALPARSGEFAFSPDSRRIVYSLNDDLYVAPAHGGTPVRLTFDHKSFAPVWGKSGIAFIRFTHDRYSDIWLSDGTPHHVRQLTHTRAGASPVAFSADGKKLLAANPATHNGRLWAVDMATGAERPLTPWVGDLFPQGLSADGSTVLAAIGCGGMIGPYGSVETIPFSGGKPHVIVHGPCRASWNAG